MPMSCDTSPAYLRPALAFFGTLGNHSGCAGLCLCRCLQQVVLSHFVLQQTLYMERVSTGSAQQQGEGAVQGMSAPAAGLTMRCRMFCIPTVAVQIVDATGQDDC